MSPRERVSESPPAATAIAVPAAPQARPPKSAEPIAAPPQRRAARQPAAHPAVTTGPMAALLSAA